MRILILTHFFPPEIGPTQARLLKTAVDLNHFGHEVKVLAALPNFPSGIVSAPYKGRWFVEETVDNIPVLRSWLFASRNRGTLRRSLSHLSFAVSSFLSARRIGLKAEVIVVDMHPIFLCITAYLLSRAWGVPFVMNANDLIPDQPAAYGNLTNPLAIAVSRRMASFVCRKAAMIVPFSSGVKSLLNERGIPNERLQTIYYGADVDTHTRDTGELPAAVHDVVGGRFLVTYAGNHGLAYGLETVLKSADLLREFGNVRFLMIGEGSEKARLVQEASKMKLDNVSFLGPFPTSVIPAILSNSDVTLVVLRRLDFIRQRVVSCKVFECMAAGRPVIVSGDGETAEFVVKARAGLAVTPEDPQRLADAILALHRTPPEERRIMGERGRRFVADNFDRQRTSRAFEDVLTRAVGGQVSK
jgi:glycosyltransferase involved in cell wall biosynthesis